MNNSGSSLTQSAFYVWVASNASTSHFPDNRPEDFRNTLAHPLTLEPSWEVGISEIYYPNNHQYIANEGSMFKLRVAYADSDADDEARDNRVEKMALDSLHRERSEQLSSARDSGFYVLKVGVPPGRHSDLSSVIAAIEQATAVAAGDKRLPTAITERRDSLLKIQFAPNDRAADRLEILSSFADRSVSIEVPDESQARLWQLLGFTDILTSRRGGPRTLPIRANTYTLGLVEQPAIYIYCDRVDHQFVGDASAPLLATVPVWPPNAARPIIWMAYDRPTYVPLVTGYISEIGISLHYDNGNLVAFESGKVLIKLHFRKQRID